MPARRGIFDRIGQDIDHDLLDALAVAHNLGQVVRRFDGHLMTAVLNGQAHGVGHLFQQVGQREARHTQLHAAVIQLGQRQKVGHDARHALGLARNDAEELLFGVQRDVARGVKQRFGIGTDIGQGRPQLVGDVRDKLAPCVIQTALLGDIVDNRNHAALAVQRAIRRERDRQHAPAARDLAGQKAAHGGLIRADHIQIGKHLVKGHVAAHAHAEQAFSGRVHVDQLAIGCEGGNAVGHMQEQGIELIAFALHLAHRAFQAAGHVVE